MAKRRKTEGPRGTVRSTVLPALSRPSLPASSTRTRSAAAPARPLQVLGVRSGNRSSADHSIRSKRSSIPAISLSDRPASLIRSRLLLKPAYPMRERLQQIQSRKPERSCRQSWSDLANGIERITL